MNQAAASVSVATLRTHVFALSRAFGQDGPAALKPLAADYQRLVRHLGRAASCPDVDCLAAALQASDALLAAVEEAHQRRAVAGISRIREAFAGVEEFIDQVPMAEPGQEPVPDPALDLPTEGLLANLLGRRVAAPAVRKAAKAEPARAAATVRRAA